jgi:hypothetical protein
MKAKFEIENAGFWARRVFRFLSLNPELARSMFRALFAGEHLHKNPPKGRKKEAANENKV